MSFAFPFCWNTYAIFTALRRSTGSAVISSTSIRSHALFHGKDGFTSNGTSSSHAGGILSDASASSSDGLFVDTGAAAVCTGIVASNTPSAASNNNWAV